MMTFSRYLWHIGMRLYITSLHIFTWIRIHSNIQTCFGKEG